MIGAFLIRRQFSLQQEFSDMADAYLVDTFVFGGDFQL